MVLPKGSAPGIWGLAEISPNDKVGNSRTYNFVETLIFEPDDNSDNYVLFSELNDNILTLKMSNTESSSYSYGYRVINEDNGVEIDGTMTVSTAAKTQAFDADVAAVIDVSSLGGGSCIAIVQVRDTEGKTVAVRNTRFTKSITGIQKVVDDSYDEFSPMYDLMGRQVKNPSRGIYIKNGKKVFIR